MDLPHPSGSISPVVIAGVLSLVLHIILLMPSGIWPFSALQGETHRLPPPSVKLLGKLINESNGSQSKGLAESSTVTLHGESEFADQEYRPSLKSESLSKNSTGLPFGLADYYYPSSQLDVRPAVLHEEEIDSAETRDIKANGKVRLQLWLDANGRVDWVEIQQSELPEIFSSAIKNAFRQFQFTPGIKNAVAVRSVIRIEITYSDTF